MTTIRDTIDRAIGAVVCNASNFPERVQARLLGQDMGPLRKRLTDAVLDALSSPPADDTGRRETFNSMRRLDDEIHGTPPADDVREALLAAVSDVLADTFSDAVTERIAADVLTRLSVTHEIRPRGTVTEPTDSGAEWEYVPGEIWTDRFGGTHVTVQSGVIASGYVDTYIAEGGDVLRRKVGPWESVTADTVREARGCAESTTTPELSPDPLALGALSRTQDRMGWDPRNGSAT